MGLANLRGRVAWVFEEYSLELNSVAAPVRNASGRVVAAIHLHGPAYRFPSAGRADEFAALVTAAAERVSARLGGVDQPAVSPPRS